MSAAAFEQATQDILKLTVPLTNTEKLNIYGLYKVAKGENINATKAPSFYELEAKAKRNAWQSRVDEGLTQEQAQQEYAKTVEELKESHIFDPNKVPEKVRS
ncbi:diazepam-binding protein inhibitor (GABA receptor modulator, acyl-CoA-binding protein) [Sporothrix brasiliensis 5110]|uniref:Diazepam-binding protein inhibitor (GABA receptor modulator, acyl-CoA-binding protein) n=1 Tax=Sporothrix brasiliensis 5110 TaxID=1398154 RepID=A0A0C2IWM2_9PEZI|nr:diazepam-binding protein inhibitor (GABA receptor modulator, acyl-CoA-binding protein) [Sporothrix brasiliensis 5110]KIH89412.1 diazepam-binding protein inhibitor (GABA receptor modulator, acyl-CoA-binding protein) [Sporothrix brasiliensis 5110]